jgi:hypothetical protein
MTHTQSIPCACMCGGVFVANLWNRSQIHYTKGHGEPDLLVYKKNTTTIGTATSTEQELQCKIAATMAEVAKHRQELEDAKQSGASAQQLQDMLLYIEEQNTLVQALKINLAVFREQQHSISHRSGFLTLQQGMPSVRPCVVPATSCTDQRLLNCLQQNNTRCNRAAAVLPIVRRSVAIRQERVGMLPRHIATIVPGKSTPSKLSVLVGAG